MQRARGFLLAFGLPLLATIGIASAAAVIIDPLSRFGSRSRPGINEQKVEVGWRARLAKPGIICRMQPTSVALGTSRVEIGIDPRHPAWQRRPGPVYNAALAGAGIVETQAMLQHVLSASPGVRQVLVGLDFLMFNAHREAVVFGTEVFDFRRDRLASPGGPSCLTSLVSEADRFLGLRGFMSAVMTVWNQRPYALRAEAAQMPHWLSLYDETGFRRDFDVVAVRAAAYGSRNLFGDGQERAYVEKIWRPAPSHRYCFRNEVGLDTREIFRSMARMATRSPAEIIFFINPIHARFLVALQQAGLWRQYEDWKRELVSILAEEGSTALRPPPPLWDFSGYNSVTTEHIPADGDRERTVRWFWEAAHYRREAGDMMLARMIGDPVDAKSVPPDFGTRLAPDNIDDYTYQTRARGRDYEDREPGEAALVKTLVDKVMLGANGSNCGDDVALLRRAERLWSRGDRAGAARAINEAVASNAETKVIDGELGFPFRETGFALELSASPAARALASAGLFGMPAH